MKAEFNPSTSTYNLEHSFFRSVEIPEGATMKQLAEFDEKVKSIVVDPTELIAKAFEDCFAEEFNDGTEEDPKEEESDIVDHQGLTA